MRLVASMPLAVKELLYGESPECSVFQCLDGTVVPVATPERVTEILCRFIARYRLAFIAKMGDPDTGHFKMHYSDYIDFATSCINIDMNKAVWTPNDQVTFPLWVEHLKVKRSEKGVFFITYIDMPNIMARQANDYIYNRFHEVAIL